jgi:hypothetical protein
MNSHRESNRHVTTPLTVVVVLYLKRAIPKKEMASAESERIKAGPKRLRTDEKLHRIANTQATMLTTQKPPRTAR